MTAARRTSVQSPATHPDAGLHSEIGAVTLQRGVELIPGVSGCVPCRGSGAEGVGGFGRSVGGCHTGECIEEAPQEGRGDVPASPTRAPGDAGGGGRSSVQGGGSGTRIGTRW